MGICGGACYVDEDYSNPTVENKLKKAWIFDWSLLNGLPIKERYHCGNEIMIIPDKFGTFDKNGQEITIFCVFWKKFYTDRLIFALDQRLGQWFGVTLFDGSIKLSETDWETVIAQM